MKKYICTVCEYIYDPAQGDPDSGIVESEKKTLNRTKDKN